MNDTVWYVIICVLFVLLGMIFLYLGNQIGKKQRKDIIISYHSDKVSKEDWEAYCKLFASGMYAMTAGFFLGALCLFFRSFVIFVPMIAGLVSGIIIIICAIRKYNR